MSSNRLRVFTGLTLLVGAATAGAQSTRPQVVVISVDGLRADIVTPEQTPTLARLAEEGASAEEAWNDLPSGTLPNHASMLTGLIGNRHGLIFNFALEGVIRFDTVFDMAASAGRRCAFFASKTKLDFLAPPDSVEQLLISDPPIIVESAIETLGDDGPDLVFVHLRDPDSTGHQFGWLSPEYLAAAANMDALIGDIADAAALSARPTYLLVTADHGGSGMNHALNTPEDRMIPFIVWGPDVVAGRVISGTVSIVDVTPTALMLLGVDAPADLSGKARSEALDAQADLGDNFVVPPVGIPCLLICVPLPALGVWILSRGVNTSPRS